MVADFDYGSKMLNQQKKRPRTDAKKILSSLSKGTKKIRTFSLCQ